MPVAEEVQSDKPLSSRIDSSVERTRFQLHQAIQTFSLLNLTANFLAWASAKASLAADGFKAYRLAQLLNL